MTYDPNKHHRRSIRLKGYDYTQAGAYFITICTQNRECLFGEVVDGEMRLNDAGTIARQCWLDIPNHFPNAELDAFVIMPNHLHGIIVLVESPVGARHAVPLPNGAVPLRNGAVPLPNGAVPLPNGAVPLRNGAVPLPNGAVPLQPQIERFGIPLARSIPTIIRSFKSATTKHINQHRGAPGAPVWQRNYYEHIICDEKSMNRIRKYILENPPRWSWDRENPYATTAETEDAWHI